MFVVVTDGVELTAEPRGPLTTATVAAPWAHNARDYGAFPATLPRWAAPGLMTAAKTASTVAP